MKPKIGITEKDLESTTQTLSVILSNETILYMKTRKFHWNISGNSFMELHLLFEGQYKELEITIDEVAERIGKLGSKTIGTLTEYIKNGTLKESPGVYPNQKEMITELLSDHEQVIKEIRKHVDNEDKEG